MTRLWVKSGSDGERLNTGGGHVDPFLHDQFMGGAVAGMTSLAARGAGDEGILCAPVGLELDHRILRSTPEVMTPGGLSGRGWSTVAMVVGR